MQTKYAIVALLIVFGFVLAVKSQSNSDHTPAVICIKAKAMALPVTQFIIVVHLRLNPVHAIAVVLANPKSTQRSWQELIALIVHASSLLCQA